MHTKKFIDKSSIESHYGAFSSLFLYFMENGELEQQKSSNNNHT